MPVETTDINQLKQKTARLSIGSNLFLVIMKLAVGGMIGSVSIISEAIHSGLDLVAALIAYISVRKSGEPPDDAHAFGHGKFEDFSGFIEAILIFVAAALILYEAIRKILGEESGLDMGIIGIGIAVMGVSALLNWLISSRLMKVAKKTESIALESDAWHLRTDVYTSLGVFAGLVAIHFTGITILDPLFAIGVALIIIKAAYDLTRRSFSDLIDHRLPDSEEERIRRIICEHSSEYADFHALRTRRSGPDRFIDLHLTVPGDATIEQAHDLADHLEADLRVEFPGANITIHQEPCGHVCETCSSNGTCGSVCRISDRRTDVPGR
ncbi:MAG: cation diffusion facilitator family transporter [Methanoregulaceae archaeon]|nr:cation diffusion facilitator family transporter [Methanoregulaceae archaeon]